MSCLLDCVLSPLVVLYRLWSWRVVFHRISSHLVGHFLFFVKLTMEKALLRKPRDSTKIMTSTRVAGSSSTGNDGATDLQRLDGFVVNERNLSPCIEMNYPSEEVRNFRRRLAHYRHVDLLQWERKRKKSSDELPVATAWPLGR